ncbi:TIGR03085 family protein [Mycolicibacterium flavescens]|uniref:TIGR03085 family protein n=1 Tax=Mycolicibacterium flavescens TaxID=1776 RepID=A0A1E3RNV3_MYCFV|nr:TIGR03085 family metal-binding protein [Mycolicibacterium flavescens]MCV7278277.1 TIGR03085 family protein [Mycolicibacterium flavescens]ODQ91529.1 TIGR03085 family protein [Mycolicibacterium flavescens]
MTAAQRERAALVATMREVGPDAPTLCGDWTTRDLAAHLVVRERRLDAAPGIMIPALAGYTDRVQRQAAQGSDWDVLLDKVASGPPVYSPFKILDPVANMGEMFIHHEDVRRAQSGWEPRPLDTETVNALTRSLPLMARMTMRRAPARVTLRTPQGKALATVGRGEPVTVTGDPQELLLFISGRDEVRLDFDGDAAAVESVRNNRGGL